MPEIILSLQAIVTDMGFPELNIFYVCYLTHLSLDYFDISIRNIIYFHLLVPLSLVLKYDS